MTTALADRFVDALERIDLEALRTCLAPAARFWVNIGPTEYSVDERFAVLALEEQHLREHRLEDVRVTVTERGFVLQFTSAGALVDGETVRVAVCLVATVADGLVTRVDEYADSAAAAPLIQAVFGA